MYVRRVLAVVRLADTRKARNSGWKEGKTCKEGEMKGERRKRKRRLDGRREMYERDGG